MYKEGNDWEIMKEKYDIRKMFLLRPSNENTQESHVVKQSLQRTELHQK